MNVLYEDDTIHLCKSVDISVAVATDAGLITPIVKDAAGRGIKSIGEDIRVRSLVHKMIIIILSEIILE